MAVFDSAHDPDDLDDEIRHRIRSDLGKVINPIPYLLAHGTVTALFIVVRSPAQCLGHRHQVYPVVDPAGYVDERTIQNGLRMQTRKIAAEVAVFCLGIETPSNRKTANWSATRSRCS